MRPDLMVATPATVAAGSTLELRFPQPTVRGIGFMLERPVDGAWVLAYQLLAAQPGEQPSWAEADAEIMIAAIGILGPGPDLLLVPDSAPPGDYRLCTNLESTYACIPIEVLPPTP